MFREKSLFLSCSSFISRQLPCSSAFRLKVSPEGMFFGFQPIPSDKQRISWQGGSSCVNTYKKRSNVLTVIIASFTPKQAMILIDKYYLIGLNNASIYPTLPIYISNVSHLYIQCLPSIYPEPPIYISNTYGLYLQHREIRELSHTKV